MAKRGYMDDEDDVALGARPSGTGRTLALLFGVAALTFAFAYYLPLHRTHSALLDEYRALADRTAGMEKDLSRARTDAKAAAAATEELSREHRANEAGRSETRARAEQAAGALKTKLGPQIDSHALRVDVRPTGVVAVTFDGALKETKTKMDVLPATAVLLCEVAAAGGDAFSFRAIGTAAEGADGWETAGNRAAAVARSLGDKCHVAPARIETRARLGGNGVPGSVVLELDPTRG